MTPDLDATEAVEARATRLYPGTTDYPLSQVGADLTALVAENKRLRDVAEAAGLLADTNRYSIEEASARRQLESALDAWRAGGGE